MIVIRNPERILSNMTVYQVCFFSPAEYFIPYVTHIEMSECLCCVVGM